MKFGDCSGIIWDKISWNGSFKSWECDDFDDGRTKLIEWDVAELQHDLDCGDYGDYIGMVLLSLHSIYIPAPTTTGKPTHSLRYTETAQSPRYTETTQSPTYTGKPEATPTTPVPTEPQPKNPSPRAPTNSTSMYVICIL